VLGGLAIASARLGNRERVEWACTQVLRLAAQDVYPREAAVALTDCSCALRHLGEDARADSFRARAEKLAAAHGFNDLVFEEAITAMNGATVPRQALDSQASRVAAQAVATEARAMPLELEAALT
jgi:hypothetical protein